MLEFNSVRMKTAALQPTTFAAIPSSVRAFAEMAGVSHADARAGGDQYITSSFPTKLQAAGTTSPAYPPANLSARIPMRQPKTYASVIYGWYTGLGLLARRCWGFGIEETDTSAALIAARHFLMATERTFRPALETATRQTEYLPPGRQSLPARRSASPLAFTIFLHGHQSWRFICNLVCRPWRHHHVLAKRVRSLSQIVYFFGQVQRTISPLRKDSEAEQRCTDSSEWRRSLDLIFSLSLEWVFWAVAASATTGPGPMRYRLAQKSWASRFKINSCIQSPVLVKRSPVGHVLDLAAQSCCTSSAKMAISQYLTSHFIVMVKSAWSRKGSGSGQSSVR